MLALVRSRGGAAEATRRVASRERLGEDWEVAQALANQRLLIVGRDEGKAEETAEIAHEALIREWPRFASWVNDDADFQHWLISAEERAADHDLLPDTRLAEADRWLAERAGDVPREVRQLVRDSKSVWLQRVTELENARNRAEARRLAAGAELALISRKTSLQIPIALAVESLRITPVLEGDIAARHAIRTAARQISRLNHDSWVNAVAFSPDGTRVATGSGEDYLGVGSARVFDAATGAEVSRLDHQGPVNAVAFSPDGTRVATGSGDTLSDCSARVFDAATGARSARLDHEGPVIAVAFSPDGTRVATGSRPAMASAARGCSTRPPAASCPARPRRRRERGGVQPGRHPGGHRQRPAQAGQARVFDAATGAELARLDHDGDVNAVAFSPDGTRVATGSGDGSARVFDAATGPSLARLDHDGAVNAVAFSPDGTRVATGSEQSARVFDAATGPSLPAGPRRPGERGGVQPGRHPGSHRQRRAVRRRQRAGVRRGHRRRALPAGPRRRRERGGVQPGRHPGSHRQRRRQRRGCSTRPPAPSYPGWTTTDAVNAVAFSPDGTRVATGSATATAAARVFDAATGAESPGWTTTAR